MANNMSLRQICHATRYVVVRLCWLFWYLKYAVILPLATMALLALLVLWKDNTTPGKLLVQEIEYVRDRTPAGLYPVEILLEQFWFRFSDASVCNVRFSPGMLQNMPWRLIGL